MSRAPLDSWLKLSNLDSFRFLVLVGTHQCELQEPHNRNMATPVKSPDHKRIRGDDGVVDLDLLMDEVTGGCDKKTKGVEAMMGKMAELAAEKVMLSMQAEVDAKIDQRINPIEQKIEDQGTRIINLEAAVTSLQEGVSEVKEQTKPKVSASVRAIPSFVPHEQRVIATIGNLGWNTEAKILLERAREVLAEVGIEQSCYSGLSGPRREGSRAELCFNSPSDLQRAKLLVREASKQYNDGHYVWLDVKKTREEMRPARIVHRMAEFLGEVETQQSEKLPIKKVLNGKYIEVGDKRVGRVMNGAWHWDAFAKARYSKEQLVSAKGFAEEE